MDYKEFRKEVTEGFRNYLPDEYKDYEIGIVMLPKNNKYRESITVTKDGEPKASPNIYLDELFSMYENGAPVDEILRSAASLYVYGLKYAKEMGATAARACARQDNIIAMVINTEKNLELLKDVPHTDYLDLSVIYRHLIALPDGTFNLATVTNEEFRKINIPMRRFHEIVLQNTKRLLPLKREHMGENVYLLSNKKRVLGANVLLFKEQLRKVCERSETDMFLVASSINEVMAIPVTDARLSFLRETLHDANRKVISPADVLSDTVYRFDWERDLLLPAWEDPSELKSWDAEENAVACN